MKNIENLLNKLANLDIQISLDGEILKINGPSQSVTPELQLEIKGLKQEIINFLLSAPPISLDKKIKPCLRSQPIKLTFGQERIWALAEINPLSSLYNVPTVFHLSGELNILYLERAIGEVQKRHEILHTTFLNNQDVGVCQIIQPPFNFILPVSDVTKDLLQLPLKQRKNSLNSLIESEVRQPFDLIKGPLWRARLFILNGKDYILTFTMHHIIFDGVSKTIFLDDLSKAYQAIKASKKSEFSKLPIQFADYAVWQRDNANESLMSRQRQYWENYLCGSLPSLAIPNDKVRVAGKSSADSIHFNFSAGLVNRLEHLGRKSQASVYVVLLSALNILLNRHTWQEDLIICAPVANRDQLEIEKLVGYFNNIVVIRSDLSSNPSFTRLVGQIRGSVINAFDNQLIPLQHIAAYPNLTRTVLTRAMLSYQEKSSRRFDLDEAVEAKNINVRKGAADFDLAFYMERDGDQLGGVVDFNESIFSRSVIQKLLQRYAEILEIVLKDPEKLLQDFPSYGRKPKNIQDILCKHSQIDSAVVLPCKKTGGLQAYLVLNEDNVPTIDGIRTYCRNLLPDYRIPQMFIPIDQLPFQENGQVDFSALPTPLNERALLTTLYVAPRTQLEIELTHIWKRVLWLNCDVGIKDTFIELGGHSLLSVHMVAEIEARLGMKVPIRALAKLDTIEHLALMMSSPESLCTDSSSVIYNNELPEDIYYGLRSYTSSWVGKRKNENSLIVGLNTEGTRKSLFWCLQRYQELSQLAKYLGEDQPVYGMRSGNRVMVKTQGNVELLARHYAEEILNIQNNGPFIIGGNCQAAKIAFQVAKQLKQKGHEIELLFLMEKFIPIKLDCPIALLFGEKSLFNPYLKFSEPNFGWRKFYKNKLTFTKIPGEHGRFFQKPNIQILASIIEEKINQAQSGFNEIANTPESFNKESQCLPPEAYRASITVNNLPTMNSGDTSEITVLVENKSAVTWSISSISGIFLRNRWFDAEHKPVAFVDGKAPLLQTLKPNDSLQFELVIRAPSKPGTYILELDLVDEGIAWFGEMGSLSLKVKCLVGSYEEL